MKLILVCLGSALLMLAQPATAAAPSPKAQASAQALHALFDSEWERGLVESPENASAYGDPRFNDRWSDLSLAAIEKRQADDRAALEQLHAINHATLSAADQLNYDTFDWLLRTAVERQKFHEVLQPVSHQGGVQTADGIAESMPFDNAKHYRDWIARMQKMPALVDQVTALMRAGIQGKNMPPNVLMQRVSTQIAAPSPRTWCRRSAGSQRSSTASTCRRRASRSLLPTCRMARRSSDRLLRRL